MGGIHAEEVAQMVSATVRQVRPPSHRKIAVFLARNQGKSFTNAQIARAVGGDRSNVWRFLNAMACGEHAIVGRCDEGREVVYFWREPNFRVNEKRLSEILSLMDKVKQQ